MASITRRSTGYQAQIRRRGYPAQSKCFRTKKEAEAWARQVEHELDEGMRAPRKLVARATLGDLLQRYGAEVTPRKRGAQVEQLRIRRLLAAPISGYNLPALTAPILANWRDERLQQVRSSTVNRELSLISAVLNVARKEWALPIDNPLPLIRRPRDPAPRSRRLSAAEEQFLLDALTPRGRSASGRFQGVQNPWLKPIVLLALETAMRRSELLALRWENVDARRRVALLPLAKNGDARAVPLSQAALDVLTALGYRDSGPVFPTSTEAVKRGFGRAVARARQAYVDACAEDGAYPHPAFLVDLHFHDLRHEATSRLAEKLHNVLELSAVTGHRDLRVLKRYYHPDPSRLALKLD